MARVLVIVADEGIRKAICHELGGEFEVLETGDPADGLGYALRSGPDCVLLDLALPQFSGLELCQTLSSVSHTRTIPIFVLMSDATLDSRNSCLNLGVREVFSRPPHFPTLKAALRALRKRPEAPSLEDVQVQLKVILKLIGQAETGKAFELLTATEQVSMNGFQCRFTVPVQQGSIVDVYHVLSSGERRVGRARLLNTEWGGMPWQTCRFQFTEKSSPWIV
jgi:DNA-binding response OmpR family regulator